MKLNDYIEYIRNPLAQTKARVVILPPGESWTILHRFYKNYGEVELRLSTLVNENAWLPMPEVVFERVRDAMIVQPSDGKHWVLLGMSGYLALLSDENKRAAIFALRKWVDDNSDRDAVCFLRNDDDIGLIIKEVFVNPRYRQGKQLVEIKAEQVDSLQKGQMEVTLVEKKLTALTSMQVYTFQNFLRYVEDYPCDNSSRQIVVALEGKPISGLSDDVRQVVSLYDFARIFHGVNDAELSEDALWWICECGKDTMGKTLLESIKERLFPHDGVEKHVLQVFDKYTGVECEALLWLYKHVASKGSYLERVVRQEGVRIGNFRSAYVTGAAEWLDEFEMFAKERMIAIQIAGVVRSDTDLWQFITRCMGESTSRVAPWLICGTVAERTELLRRCTADGFVSNIVKEVCPEIASYLNKDFDFGGAILEEYFNEYRELKMTGSVTPEFCDKAQNVIPPDSVKSRDAIVQSYASDEGCALLVVDAMGAEWLPMLVTMAQQQNIGVHSIAVGKANLPTSTKFNNLYWPDENRRLSDIKRFDNIAHNGVEAHEKRKAEENLASALNVISHNVMPRIAEGLAQFDRVLVTADHGSSRLALLASKAELIKTLTCEKDAYIADWRYRERPPQGECPPELEETLDGKYWVVRGYNRLPKKGGGQGFEVHGGAALEERLVPVVIFSRKGQFATKARTADKRLQIVENDDFDL